MILNNNARDIYINDKQVKRIVIGSKMVYEYNEYAQFEDYIRGTGTQYIDTSYVPQVNFGFVIKFQTQSDVAQENYGCLMGSQTSDEVNDYQLTTYGTTSGTLRLGTNNSYDAGISEKDIIYTASLKNGTYTAPNGTTATVSYSGNGANALFLFALNQAGTAGQSGSGARIFLAELYNGNTLVKRFVPCKLRVAIAAGDSHNWSSTISYEVGAVGMWEEQEQKFYGNAGTGVFYASSDEYKIIYKGNNGEEDYIQYWGTAVDGSKVTLKPNMFTLPTNKVFGSWMNVQTKVANCKHFYQSERVEFVSYLDGNITTLYANWIDDYFEEVADIRGVNSAWIDTKYVGQESAPMTLEMHNLTMTGSGFCFGNADQYQMGLLIQNSDLTKEYGTYRYCLKGAGGGTNPRTPPVMSALKFFKLIPNSTNTNVLLVRNGVNDQNLNSGGVNTSNGSLRLFCRRSGYNIFTGRIGMVAVATAAIKRRLFLPCKLTKNIPSTMDSRNIARSAGTYGMWDVISNVFFGSMNSGYFTNA